MVFSATTEEGSADLVFKPDVFAGVVAADGILKKAVGTRVSQFAPYLSSLSTKHNLITHVGVALQSDPEDVEWTALAANAPVQNLRRRGQRGGYPTCPQVKFAPANTRQHTEFLTAARAVYTVSP